MNEISRASSRIICLSSDQASGDFQGISVGENPDRVNL